MGRSSELAVIDRLFRWGAAVGDDDARLLERFRERRDEVAFAALVDRHGPMVLGVCRRALRDDRDVEDAFQATFLILARRAGTIRGAGGVGPWLHGVAHRVATRARADAARRYVREGLRLEVEPPAVAVERKDERDDLRAIVDDELARLPGRFRDPVVLCHMEGLTHDQAADRLRLPVGTVRSRLARARNKLRDRLERRGLSAADASAILPLAEPLPPALLEATLRSSLASATTPASTLAAAGAVALADGVLRTMTFSQTKFAAAALGTLLTLGGASGYAIQQGGGGKSDAPADSTPTPTTPEQVSTANEPIATEGGVGRVNSPPKEELDPPPKAAPAGVESDKEFAKNLQGYLERIEEALRSKRYEQYFLRTDITSMEGDVELIRRKLKALEAKMAVGVPGSLFVTTEKPALPADAPTARESSLPEEKRRAPTPGVVAESVVDPSREEPASLGAVKALSDGVLGANAPGATEQLGREMVRGQAGGRTANPPGPVGGVAAGGALQPGRERYIVGPQIIIAPSSNGRVLTGYSQKVGKAKAQRFAPDDAPDVQVVPILGPGVAAVLIKGGKIERIAVFSASDGEWHTQELREPTDEATPKIGPGLVVYQLGRRVYAFGATANRWDVLDLDGDLKAWASTYPPGITKMMNANGMAGSDRETPFSFQFDSIMCQDEHKIHIFSGQTGTWTSIELETPAAAEDPMPRS